MLGTRWRKAWRDVQMDKGRFLMMLAALTASVLGIGVLLGALSILTGELSRNYLDTRPATASFEVDSADARLAAAVRELPGVSEAEARDSILARARVDDTWVPVRLFVINDFSAMRLNVFTRESGTFPPPDGSMLVERTAPSVLKVGPGQALQVKTPGGSLTSLSICGVVHDPSLAPSWQEMTGYAYISPATLRLLGESGALHELRVEFTHAVVESGGLNRAARDVGRWLEEQGQRVDEIQIPPPYRHPHFTQMAGVLTMMLVFSSLALLLSAILVATLVEALLAKQTRQIGAMKASGATSGQIAGMYISVVAALGLVAVLIAALLAPQAALKMSVGISQLLNFDLVHTQLPWWVFAAQAALGILVPVGVSLFPILRRCGITVREALADYGVAQPSFGMGRLERWLTRSGGSRLLLLALRNGFRRRGRLALTLSLLGAAGAMFMASLNTAAGWENYVQQVPRTRFYDFEVLTQSPESADGVIERLRAIAGVKRAEAWGYVKTAFAEPGQLDITHTYPDGGHGSFALLGVPDDCQLVRFPLAAGRWISAEDTDAVVLNQMARAVKPSLRVGDTISLSVQGRPVQWRVVGFITEVGSPAKAYVSASALSKSIEIENCAGVYRIASSGSAADKARVIASVDQLLQAAGSRVKLILPLAMLKTAMGEHVAVLIQVMLALALIFALVGGLGLASVLGMNVVERTRELGVMSAIGATPAKLVQLIASEGLSIVLMSYALAVIVALPLTAVVGRVVGMMSFRVPLSLVVSFTGAAGWLGLVVAIATLATAYPALLAARLTVREALAYE